MPRRYVRKTKRPKRKPKTKGRIHYGLKAPLPNSLNTKLRYVDEFNLNPTAGGVPAVHVFSCNGLYDTNITGTGHQPRGFDQLMTMYAHYVVVGAKCTVSFMHSTAVLYNNMVVGVALKAGSPTLLTRNDYQEGRNVSYKTLLGSSTASGNNSGNRVTKTASTRKFLGQRPFGDNQLKGSSSANPAEQLYFHCFACPYSSTDEATLQCSITIEYLVRFIEPIQPSQS